MQTPGVDACRKSSVVKLPPGFHIYQASFKNKEPGVFFEIERNGDYIAFNLAEAEALAVALAILGVSIEIRDTGDQGSRPRLIRGQRVT
jgi:hypothetical protein